MSREDVLLFGTYGMRGAGKSYYENLKELRELLEYKNDKIERQKEIIRQLDIKNLELTTIIKEVREYINSIGWNTTIPNIQDNVWRILDKEK